MKKERIAWIDQLKGVAFFTVILGHTAINETFKSWIYSFHMPLFLLITGFTLSIDKMYQTDFRSFAAKNAKRMLIPYAWCQLICILLELLRTLVTSKGFAIKNYLFGIFVSNSRLCLMPSLPGYYITLLFLAQLTLWAVIKVTKADRKKAALIIAVLAAFAVATGKTPMIWHLNVVPTAVLVIFIGRMLMDFYSNHKEKISGLSPFKYSLLCASLLAVGAVFWFFNKRISLHYNSYGNEYIFFLISMLATCSGFSLIFIKLKPLAVFDYVGKNTLFYMLMHLSLLYLLQDIQGDFSEKAYMNYVNAAVIFVLLIPLTKLTEKCASFLLGRPQSDLRLSSKIGAYLTTALAFAAVFFKVAEKVAAAVSPILYIPLIALYLILCFVFYLIVLDKAPVLYLCEKDTAKAVTDQIKAKIKPLRK